MHVIVRSFSLLVLGLILANADKADRSRMGMSGSAWALLGLIGAGLYLNVYPKPRKTYMTVLRAYRLDRRRGGVRDVSPRRRRMAKPAWIDFSYPEILGLIAFAYFAVALLYIPTRRWRWAAPAWFVLLLALNICSTARLVPFLSRLSNYVWPFGNGSHVALVMAGVVTSQIFFGLRPGADERPPANRRDPCGGFVCAARACGGLAVRAAGNLEDPRHSGVDVVECWRGCAGVHAALLDLRSVAENCVGRTCAASRIEYAAYLSAARSLVFCARRIRLHMD